MVEPAKRNRWVLLLHLLLLGLPMFAIYIGVLLAISIIKVPTMRAPGILVATSLLACALLLLAYRFGIWLIERRSASEAGLTWSAGDLSAGIAIGILAYCAAEAIVCAAGYGRYAGFDGFAYVIPMLAIAILAAVAEEIIFRGVVFQLLDEAFGTTIALIASAILFGAAHAFNPGATLISTAAIAIEAGVLLGLAFALTRTLWLPIGIHLGWNFTEGGIFGGAVSGGESHGIFDIPLNGPTLWTGGAFGLEASLPAVLTCLTAAILIGWKVVQSGQWHAYARRDQAVG